jgi:hypothetical protein
MMPMQLLRLALRDHVTADDVDRLAWREDWEIHGIIPRTGETPHEVVFAVDEGTTVHYVEDFVLGRNYLVVRGDRARVVVDRIQTKLATYSRAELIEAARGAKTANECIRAITLLAITSADDLDEEVLHHFAEAAACNDPRVRRRAILGMGYVEWSEFAPILERLERGDPEPEVREDARLMREGLESIWR